jgi:hypothetical protein
MSNDTLDLDALTLHMPDWPAPETCKDCGVVVRYYNGAGGNAWCECCTEGAEACGTIPMPDGVTVEDIRALLARARESATRDARIAALTAALADAVDLAENAVSWLEAGSDKAQRKHVAAGHRPDLARLRALLGTEGANG